MLIWIENYEQNKKKKTIIVIIAINRANLYLIFISTREIKNTCSLCSEADHTTFQCDENEIEIFTNFGKKNQIEDSPF